MNKINVIAFGGLGGNLFSAGLKTILLRLDGVPGIDFKTYEDWSAWQKWGASLQSWRDPTVLLGHSFGVAAMFGAVRAMDNRGPQIPLAISFDPSQWWGFQPSLWRSGGNVAPDRITRVLNFYQRGVPIGFQTLQGEVNVLVENVSHAAIEDVPELQNRAVNEIKAVIAALNPPQPVAA